MQQVHQYIRLCLFKARLDLFSTCSYHQAFERLFLALYTLTLTCPNFLPLYLQSKHLSVQHLTSKVCNVYHPEDALFFFSGVCLTCQ